LADTGHTSPARYAKDQVTPCIAPLLEVADHLPIGEVIVAGGKQWPRHTTHTPLPQRETHPTATRQTEPLQPTAPVRTKRFTHGRQLNNELPRQATIRSRWWSVSADTVQWLRSHPSRIATHVAYAHVT
jgi:hypothetical protein